MQGSCHLLTSWSFPSPRVSAPGHRSRQRRWPVSSAWFTLLPDTSPAVTFPNNSSLSPKSDLLGGAFSDLAIWRSPLLTVHPTNLISFSERTMFWIYFVHLSIHLLFPSLEALLFCFIRAHERASCDLIREGSIWRMVFELWSGGGYEQMRWREGRTFLGGGSVSPSATCLLSLPTRSPLDLGAHRSMTGSSRPPGRWADPVALFVPSLHTWDLLFLLPGFSSSFIMHFVTFKTGLNSAPSSKPWISQDYFNCNRQNPF